MGLLGPGQRVPGRHQATALPLEDEIARASAAPRHANLARAVLRSARPRTRRVASLRGELPPDLAEPVLPLRAAAQFERGTDVGTRRLKPKRNMSRPECSRDFEYRTRRLQGPRPRRLPERPAGRAGAHRTCGESTRAHPEPAAGIRRPPVGCTPRAGSGDRRYCCSRDSGAGPRGAQEHAHESAPTRSRSRHPDA